MWLFEPKYVVAQNTSNLSDKLFFYMLWNFFSDIRKSIKSKITALLIS